MPLVVVFFVSLFVSLPALCCSASAHAQARAGARPIAAKTGHVDPSIAARIAFQQGHYREALDQYERAYELTGAPVLLYEIGQTADRLRLDATTLRAFQLYLERYPDAPNREEVRNRIHALEPSVRTEGADLDAESGKTLRGKPASALSETLIPSPYAPAQAAVAASSSASSSTEGPLMPSPYVLATETAEPSSQTLLASPWFWLGTGAFVVLVTSLVIVSANSGAPQH